MGLKDINETFKLLTGAVSKLAKIDLETRDATYRELIPVLERFNTTLKTGKWDDIGREGEALAALPSLFPSSRGLISFVAGLP